jgi:hypothetical protein
VVTVPTTNGTRVGVLAAVGEENAPAVGDGNIATVGMITKKPAVGVQTTATVRVGAGLGGGGVG